MPRGDFLFAGKYHIVVYSAGRYAICVQTRVMTAQHNGPTNKK